MSLYPVNRRESCVHFGSFPPCAPPCHRVRIGRRGSRVRRVALGLAGRKWLCEELSPLLGQSSSNLRHLLGVASSLPPCPLSLQVLGFVCFFF